MEVMTKAPKGAKLIGNWISPKMLKLLMPPAAVHAGFEAFFWPYIMRSSHIGDWNGGVGVCVCWTGGVRGVGRGGG